MLCKKKKNSLSFGKCFVIPVSHLSFTCFHHGRMVQKFGGKALISTPVRISSDFSMGHAYISVNVKHIHLGDS